MAGGAGPKPMVPTMPPFFLLGRAVFPGWEKKTFVTGLVWGIVDYLMLVCYNVRITGEFSNFLVPHLMRLFGIPLKLEVFTKGLQGGGFLLCHWLLLVFWWSGLVRLCWESNFYDCCMEEADEGGLNAISKYGPGRRLQGMSGVGIVCVWENILELYAPFLAVSLGGSKTGMESSAAKNTPPPSNQRGSLCSFPPSLGPSFLASTSTLSSFLAFAHIFFPLF